MARSKVLRTKKGQVVRLPESVALPQGVREVEVTKIGRSRLISPIGRSWDAFFDNVNVSEDFMRERKQPRLCDNRRPL